MLKIAHTGLEINIVHDDAEKAEAFNTFFSSQSNIDDTE
jgi:hypothetical protein